MSLPQFNFQPHQITPLLATPRTIALLFAGTCIYTGYIDAEIRRKLPTVRQQLTQWVGMFKPSLKMNGIMAIVSGLFGIAAYYKTKVNLYLVGAGLMLGLWPYTLAFLMPINNYLLKVDKQTQKSTQMTSAQKFTVKQKIQSWVKIHRGRLFISLAAAVVFYLAQVKTSENIGLNVTAK